MIAYEACSAKGQQLIDLSIDTTNCGGKAKMAKYTCCTPAPQQPPPNPPSCDEIPQGDGSTCKDMSTIKQEAVDLCTTDGGSLFDLKFGGDCPNGQASKFVAVCCGS